MQLVFNFFDDDIAENNKHYHTIKCNKYQKQGLVYLGSKRGIADKIYHAIINTLGGVKINRFVDLFCGGGAMGFCAALHGERVLMNDDNQYLIHLLYSIVNNKIPPEWKKDFISREEYQALKDFIANKSYFEIDKQTALRYAFASFFFSFGGRFGKSYIYGKDIEKQKEIMHKTFIFNDLDAKKELENIAGFEFKLKKDFTPYENYLFYKKQGREKIGKPRSETNKCIEFDRDKSDLQHLEHLQHLERLQHLEHLEHLERLEFSSIDYADFQAEKGDIIYCDPPYENTAKYIKGVNHNSFFEWALSNKNAVFISEYQDLTKYGFIKIFEIEKRQLLNRNSDTKTNTEYLFWNGKK